MDRKKVLDWFTDVCEYLLKKTKKYFIMQCTTYVGYVNLGIKINGLIIDTMIAASLIDENRFSIH